MAKAPRCGRWGELASGASDETVPQKLRACADHTFKRESPTTGESRQDHRKAYRNHFR